MSTQAASASSLPLGVYQISDVWSAIRKAGDNARQLANASASDIVASVLQTNDVDLLQRYYDQALADHKAARESKANATKSAIASDWTLFSKRLYHHFDKAHLRVSFPNVNGAGGTVTLTAKTEAQAAAKAQAAEKAAEEKRENEAHQSRMAMNQAAALQAMTVDQIADTLAEAIKATGHSIDDVLASLANRYQIHAKPQAASRKPRASRKPKAETV